MPKEARWSHIRGMAEQPHIGNIIDTMDAKEGANPSHKDVLHKEYARASRIHGTEEGLSDGN